MRIRDTHLHRPRNSILALVAVTLMVAALWWLSQPTRTTGVGATETGSADTDGARPRAERLMAEPFRLALIPERDIFDQRHRYRVLTEYLAARIGRPIELVTLNTYEGVLNELAADRLDGAFVGSMVAVLAADRLDARIIAKPVQFGGVERYRAVIFVREDSPIRTIEDLAAKSVAMVRTTMAGNLFPICVLAQHDMLTGPVAPTPQWVGTHDDVIREVVTGHAQAGAAKDLRILDYEQRDDAVPLRWLEVSEPVPNNALIVAEHVQAETESRLREALLTMHQTSDGRQALAAHGAERFVTCDLSEYRAVFDMLESDPAVWRTMGIEGPAPARPAAAGRTTENRTVSIREP